jgi:hypothetical protein
MSKSKTKPVVVEETKLEFETFRKINSYNLSQWEQKEPDCFNGVVSVHRYRVTVELIEEPKEVIIERLKTLWRNTDNYHHYRPLQDAAKKLGFQLDANEIGIDRRKK